MKYWLYLNESMMVIFLFSIEKEEPKNLFFIQSIRTHAHRYYHFAFLLNLDRQNRDSRASRQQCKWQTLVLSYVLMVKSMVEISQNFVAFSRIHELYCQRQGVSKKPV